MEQSKQEVQRKPQEAAIITVLSAVDAQWYPVHSSKKATSEASKEGRRLKHMAKMCPWSLWGQQYLLLSSTLPPPQLGDFLLPCPLCAHIQMCWLRWSSWHWTCLGSYREGWPHVLLFLLSSRTQPLTPVGIDICCGSALSAPESVLRAKVSMPTMP